MKIIDGRGLINRKAGEKTQMKIFQFFKDNPDKTKADCARALSISYPTVSKYVKRILKEQMAVNKNK